MAQMRRRRVEASAVKNCKAILSADIIPRSKNVCLHRHFCEAVNGADAPTARGGFSREELQSNSFCAYYTTLHRLIQQRAALSRYKNCLAL